MIVQQARDVVSRTLRPFAYDTFFNEIVGRKPLAVLGAATSGRLKMLGDDPRQTILDAYDQYAPNLTCHIRNPVQPPPSPRPVAGAQGFRDLIDEYHQRGYTVRVPDATHLAPELSLLTRALESLIGSEVGVVIFWSDNEAEAPVHDDEVDVIVIQLVGTKRWFISDEPPTLANKWKALGKREPSLGKYSTYDVEPGDLLYLPRGTAHTVRSTSESIHLSIGFVPLTVREAISFTLDRLSDLDRPLRGNIGTRADGLEDKEELPGVLRQVREGIARLEASARSDEFVREALAHRRARLMLDLPRLVKPSAPVPISTDTLVRHSPLAVAQLIATREILDFRQPGEQILIHLGAAATMEFIARSAQFRVSDVPGEIGDDVRIALISRLIGSGFLEVV